jgi:hypothetical protein
MLESPAPPIKPPPAEAVEGVAALTEGTDPALRVPPPKEFRIERYASPIKPPPPA